MCWNSLTKGTYRMYNNSSIVGWRAYEFDIRWDHIPGYQKIITDQGMPISTEPGKRGNLRIKFFVEFPTHLTIIKDLMFLVVNRILVS
jgi:DnaJ-class molecular chaperone